MFKATSIFSLAFSIFALTSACGGPLEDPADTELSSTEDAVTRRPSRQCTATSGAILGQCGTDFAFPDCTPAWADSCVTAGGTVGPPTSCPVCSSGGDEQCSDSSWHLPDCDDDFTAGCALDGGHFVCTDPSGRECYEGYCHHAS